MGSATTIEYRATWDLGAGFVSIPGYLGAEIALEATEGTSGLGGAVFASATATIRTTDATAASAWQWATVKVEIKKNGGSWEPAYLGPATDRSDDGTSYRYQCAGWDAVIERQPVRMPLRERRPIATATAGVTASAEDPTTGAPGLINEALWRAGGRPEHLSGTYPSATFYYACDASAMAPPYGGVDVDNPWQEVLELAQAAGGQLMQDRGGVLRYLSPLRLADTEGSPPHLTNSDYRRMTVDESVAGTVAAAIATYQRRAAQAVQPVYEDTTPRSLAPGETYAETLTMRAWVKSYVSAVVAATPADGSDPIDYTVTIVGGSAQRADLEIVNPSTTARLLVERITIYGEPVTVVSEGEARVEGSYAGRYAPEQRLPSNRYIQEADDAERWARQAQLFAAQFRPVYRLSGVVYRPELIPGAYVLLTNTRRSLASVGCRVIRATLQRSGAEMSVELVPIADLPALSDFFVIGETYADGDTRQYGF